MKYHDLFENVLDPETLEEAAWRAEAQDEGRRDGRILWAVSILGTLAIVLAEVFGK